LKLLHIDDEEDFLFLTRLGLQSINNEIEIDSVLDPREALTRIESANYDAIICDYEMNELDGLGLLSRLREKGNNTPFIVVTGKSREEIVIKALNLGADFYIEKSLDQKVFYAELHHLLLSAISKNKNLDALLTSESRARALAESTSVGFWQANLEGEILYVNDSMIRMTEFSNSEDVYDHKIDNIIIPFEIDKNKQTQFPKTYEGSLQTSNGNKKFGIISSAPIYDSSGVLESFIGTFTDITELRLTEQALRESEEQLKREKDELSTFAHMMAHDLRNMLSSIHGYASLLEPKNDDEELVENIKKVANKSFQFLNRSLELAEAGRVVEKQDKVQFNHIIKETGELIVPKDIKLAIEGDFPVVVGDNEKIYQIFKNLLENAVKHGKPSKIDIKYNQLDNKGFITVSNNGIKINENIKNNLFDSKLKGLGFKIIKKIVDAHDWKISIIDVEDTTFQLEIPLET
jgi:PAS domain S-box-containing protein